MNDNEAAEKAAPIIEMLLAIPEKDRADVWSAVKYNGIFCHHCGFGSRKHPNPNCQCWNDA